MEFKERQDAFMEEYGKLREKYHVDIVALPGYTPNKEGTFDLRISIQPVDVEDEYIKTPFIPDAK